MFDIQTDDDMPNVFPYDTDANPPFLRGQTVFLQPAREEDRELIRPLAKDPRLWEFTKTLLIDDAYDSRFDAYFDEALRLPELDGRAFIVRTAGDGKSNVCPSDNEPPARSGLAGPSSFSYLAYPWPVRIWYV